MGQPRMRRSPSASGTQPILGGSGVGSFADGFDDDHGDTFEPSAQ